ncbi:MAG: 1-acyl-sn-glycerol-3-phosphate acyltransferase [Syntrophobacterales bacterium]|nr:1-acyl-sn-glycerol-3-phosphate acyltransferase [Syntrophobacterales bacterium]
MLERLLSRFRKRAEISSFQEIAPGYECPGKPSVPLQFIFYRMIAMGTMPIDQQKTLEELSKQGVIIYAIKYRSAFDFFYLKTRLYQLGLPDPVFAFDMKTYRFLPFLKAWKLRMKHFLSFLRGGGAPDPYDSGAYERHIEQGNTGVMFLLGKKAYLKRALLFGQDPLQFLLEVQKKVEKPIFIVPCSIVYIRHPGKENSSRLFKWSGRDRIGSIRRFISFIRGYRYAVLEIGEPVNLKDVFPELSSITVERRSQIFQFRNSLIESINRINRAVVGPSLKSKLELKEMILHNPRLQKVMQRRAKSKGCELWEVQKEADRYLEEIAADYSYTFIKWMETFFSWVWNHIFDGIEVDEEGFRRIKKLAQHHTLVYVPSHKSHLDYLLLSYLFFRHNLYPPFIAAGHNLAFWPAGPIFRRAGAFFIRRSFSGQRFYAEVFSVYVKTLIRLGHNIEFFIEGGRSRTGKLVLPKLGLLSIIIQAYEEKYCEDLIFIPTSICYDQIPETESYVRELKGENKKPEDIKQLVGARRVLRKRYGKVYVRFGKPISLAQYVSKQGIDLAHASSKERHALYKNLALAIIENINEASVVTPHALAASALLTTAKHGITLQSFRSIAKLFHDYLIYVGVHFARTFTHPETVLEEALESFEREKVITRLKAEDPDEDDVIVIDGKKRHTLEYYKNNTIHFLLPVSFVSLSILAQKTFEPSVNQIIRDYQWLRELFKYEFAYSQDEQEGKKEIEKVINFFLRQRMIIPGNNEDQYHLTHEGLHGARAFASLMYNYLEGYKICFSGIKLVEKKNAILEQDLVKKFLNQADKMLSIGVIERPEAISKVMYENALRFLEEKEILNKKVEQSSRKPPKEHFTLGEAKHLASAYIKEISRFLGREGL